MLTGGQLSGATFRLPYPMDIHTYIYIYVCVCIKVHKYIFYSFFHWPPSGQSGMKRPTSAAANVLSFVFWVFVFDWIVVPLWHIRANEAKKYINK